MKAVHISSIFFGLLLISNTNLFSRNLLVDSITVFGPMSTNRLQSVLAILHARDSLIAVGASRITVKLHQQAFDKCFEIDDEISIVKGSSIIGEFFFSNGNSEVLKINPIDKRITIVALGRNFKPSSLIIKDWEAALFFFILIMHIDPCV